MTDCKEQLPECVYRGTIGRAKCYCRHPQNARDTGSRLVPKSQCDTCPLRSLNPEDYAAVERQQAATIEESTPKRFRLGDKIESALTAVGVTKERVSKWLGRPCNCEERKQKLNQLSEWAQNATAEGLRKLIGE